MYFTYDGLNRQVSRKSGTNGTPTFSVWDGWNLIEEYQSAGGGATTAAYLYGATGLISGVTNGQFAYYFQDASGSTSHLTDVNGNLLEWYRYDLQGTPIFYNASDQQISASAYGVSYLFTGQQWRSEIGLYDLRNRFYSPNIGRLIQPDPIGFRGDRTNLYRYCGNNPISRWDPLGLQQQNTKLEQGAYPYPEVRVYAPPLPGNISRTGFLQGSFTGSRGGPGDGDFAEYNPFGHLVGDKIVYDYNPFPRPREEQKSESPSVQQPLPSNVPEQNVPQPPATSVTFAAGPGLGFQITVTHDYTGQSFLTLGGQVGKSWPYSFAATGEYVIGHENPSASQIAKSKRGFGWSATGGYYSGFQLSGPATWQIFLPGIGGAGAGSPTMWSGGFVTPQFGVGLGYTWQLPTLANPLPPYSPTTTSEGP